MDSINTPETASYQDTQLPIYGIDFRESLWDEEFRGRLDELDRIHIQTMIEEGCGPFFLSTAFLPKSGYQLNAGANPCAVLKDDSEHHLIYSVHDISKPFKRPPEVGAYSEKWRGRWLISPGDCELINESGLISHYGLTKTWVTRLEEWMTATIEEVMLVVDYQQGPPIRLYECRVVEDFIHKFQTSIKRTPKKKKGSAWISSIKAITTE